jgi:tyrosinase
MTLVHRILVLTEIPGLAPFWESPTQYWLSSQTTATGNLKYSYPEFNGLDLGNTNAVRTAIANTINQLYGGGGGFSALGAGPQVLLAQPPAGGAQAPLAQAASVQSAAADAHPFHSRGGPPHAAQTPVHGKEAPSALNDWTARIHFKKYELGGSFAVLLFLGEVPEDASKWRSCRSLVGSHHAFVNSAASQCDNCRDQADIVVEGFVHLNSAIAAKSGLSSYDPGVVSPYLKDNLHWRIQAVRVFPFASFRRWSLTRLF